MISDSDSGTQGQMSHLRCARLCRTQSRVSRVVFPNWDHVIFRRKDFESGGAFGLGDYRLSYGQDYFYCGARVGGADG
jgi:hypothetical protein